MPTKGLQYLQGPITPRGASYAFIGASYTYIGASYIYRGLLHLQWSLLHLQRPPIPEKGLLY